jgi:hypothetical protein
VAQNTDKLVLASWVLTAAIIVATAGIGVVYGKYFPSQIPIFYSRPWGEDQLGKPVDILIPMGLAVVCGIGSGYLYKILGEKKVLAKLVLVSGIVIQLILALGMLRVVLLVT